jgi:anaerobic selenocysteine-containing dehydrogenase
MNRDDANELGIGDDDRVELDAGNGKIVATLTCTDDLARGVVSLPHGFSETDLGLSSQRKGPNYNSIIATSHIDVPSATAALNGVSVVINRLG